ncbi:methionine--tRNA ligase [bacterium]|nr:methionine--tRNA ligase [bacterium]
MPEVFYITTPIYYVSGQPHLGNAYTTIACDVLARYHRLRGELVVFATGTDEHGNKSVLEAAKAGLAVDEYVAQMVGAYQGTWERMHVKYDRFIRTSEEEHVRVVQDVFARLRASDDIYLGEYEGWYCVPCETYLLEADIADGKCPDCGREVKRVAEPAYFLRTSKYADRLLDYIEDNERFIMPEGACKEVLAFIKQGLRDACISRARTDWDIPVPGDDSQSIYVWFDALINYLTVAGYGVDEAKFAQVWPPSVQVMAKDILPRFHATIWPAMLMALGVPLPEMIFAHGWWLADSGDKMSKSKGNFVLPYETAVELAEQSGARTAVAVDALRYFVLREVPFGLDGSFSFRALVGRFNADLANDLGNLLNRSLPLVERYLDGVVPTPGPGAGNLAESITRTRATVEQALEVADFRGALEAIWELLGEGNKFLHEREPWTLHKDGKQVELEAVLYDALDCVRVVAIMIAPFMPEVAEEICRQLGLAAHEALQWERVEAGQLPPGTKIERDNPIFPRMDMERLEQKLQGREQQQAALAPPQPEAPVVSFDQFKQMDLRVGRVLEAERVPGADKLLKLLVDIGEPEPRQIVAGIAQEFNPRELLERAVIVIANLEPAKIRGVESRGMLLAAGAEQALALLTVDADVPVGTKVR